MIAGLFLAILAAVQIGSAIEENATNDEANHLTAGFVYLTTREYMNPTHPPLARILGALPLLALPLDRIPAERAWDGVHTLLWQNRIPADTILLRARLMMIALTVLLGAWLAWWTKLHFGAPVSLIALAFFAFDPNVRSE